MSARSRGAAPSMDMLNRPVQVGDLENLRVVDLKALAKNMGVQLKSNMRKAEIISSLSGAMGGRSVMLDREVAAVSSSGNARSRGAASSSMNAADTDRFLQDLVLGANQMTGDTYEGYRTKWQYLVSKVTGRFGVNAAEAARMLGPYYTSERSRGSSSPRSRSPSRNGNSRSRSSSPRSRSNGNNGGYRSEWQRLVSETTQQYGVNAAEAARMLGPQYESQRERSRGRSNSY